MSETTQTFLPVREAGSFTDYVDNVSRAIGQAVSQEAVEVPPLNLDMLNTDLMLASGRIFRGHAWGGDSAKKVSGPRAMYVVESLRHEVLLLDKLHKAGGLGAVLPEGTILSVIPIRHTTPIADKSSKLAKHLYLSGANDQAIREIGIGMLDRALGKGGMSRSSARRALLHGGFILASAEYDPSLSRTKKSVGPDGKERFELIGHDLEVHARDLRDMPSIGTKILSMAGARQATVLPGLRA